MEAPRSPDFEILQGLTARKVEFKDVPTQDLFSALPSDITCEIFTHLKPEAVLRARCVSKKWNVLLVHDIIWKGKVESIFGEVKKEKIQQTWFELYNELVSRWSEWDAVAHHPGLILPSKDVANCDPNCKNDTHLPIRGAVGVLSGRHYFEVTFATRAETRPAFSSLLCAVGLADQTFPTERKMGAGYTKDNNGIGYYSSGFQFLYGKEVEYGTRITFKSSNTVGYLLDMDAGFVQFYKDRKPIGHIHSLRKELLGKVKLYPLVLSERGVTVQITTKPIGSLESW